MFGIVHLQVFFSYSFIYFQVSCIYNHSLCLVNKKDKNNDNNDLSLYLNYFLGNVFFILVFVVMHTHRQM